MPVPLLEAFALPILPERATPKPTPICIYHPFVRNIMHGHRKGLHKTYPWASTVAFSLARLEFAKFLRAKNKASSKRHSIYMPPVSLRQTEFRRGSRNKDKGKNGNKRIEKNKLCLHHEIFLHAGEGKAVRPGRMCVEDSPASRHENFKA